MKIRPNQAIVLLLMLTLFAASLARASVGLTVSPAAISNTYPGVITLNITGLTNFQSIKVQTYLDLNSNGVVDPGEPLLDAFNLKESGVTVIGGITNLNVPYDSNPATDTITTTLSFAPPLQNIVGQKIYRVIGNPSSAFTPVTAVMDVTNAALSQSVSGVVYSNGLSPLPNAIVAALTQTNQNLVGAAVADASGHYFLTLPPGSYFLLPVFPGYFANQKILPLVILTNGLAATNDLVISNGVVTISGTVSDVANSNTLGGILVQAQSSGLMGIAFTDTNGLYTFGATSNNWKIKISAEGLARRGYLTLQSGALTADAAAGSVSGADISLYKGDALFYGRLTTNNVPVPNVSVECNDDSQIYSGKGYTDQNGNYTVAALVNTNALPAGTTWYASTSSGAQLGLLNNYIFNSADQVDLSSNSLSPLNLIGLPVTTAISGRLLNNQGTPLTGVSVGANADIGGLQYGTAYVQTDTNGYFNFGATSGNWYVTPNCCGNNSLDQQGYYEPGLTEVTIPPANPVVNLTVYPANQPVLGQPLHLAGSLFDVNLYGANGYNYTVQTSTNLAKTNWLTLTVISNLSSSPYLIQDNQATNTARFYRAFQGP